MNLGISSETPSKKQINLPKWLIWGFIAVSFIGFLDAGYLTVVHYTGADLACSFLEGCEIVTTSKYSLIFGIPVALLGALYYLTILILSLLYFDTKNNILLKIFPALTIFGFLASGWFIYLQIFVIKALCEYCILSAVTSTILFILGLYTIVKHKP
ncbi:hypothetical protein A3B60_03830 [Candidatus Peregrinibacteria bacterium RIFCSPLOWO2_01_FULL_39_12]|nr:MAG: hypothetical protein A3B60_03830 [Candidatus Peregrinibacteria bacterium RIFCSPLOWO2_01_FULL_39_12]